MSEFNVYATFITSDAHREYFSKGNLVEEWSRMYSFLFDNQDSQIALNQRHLGYHYYEWLAAILLYHTRGFLSLVETYSFKSHEHQWKILETLVSGDTMDFIASKGVGNVTQCPDLLVYTPNRKEWFFCEVKGPKDKLRKKQIDFFHELERVSDKKLIL